jgi:beta-lactamase superfamily II metal-dependent hydrolase
MKPNRAETPRVRTKHRTSHKSEGVRIRMYDVGFGDCFLLFIPTTQGERKLLIDCGSIAKHTRSITEIVEEIISDVTDSDGKPRIDVVIATHRHRDHISGFADRRWSEVEVKEVWMPWTERPDDPIASRIRQAQTRLAAALHQAFMRLNAAQDLKDLALNALSNDDAMQVLHHGFAGLPRRRFLPERDCQDRILRTDVLPGVFVHVLGPSYEEDAIRDMDPPAGQSYVRLAGEGALSGNLPEPFSHDWVVETPFRGLEPDDEAMIQGMGAGREEALAAQLDQAVNGTSLMLFFQVGDAHLLFPGDAQWGTWKIVLNDPETQRLLDKVNFYKVGHHGSHNATPIDFVERHLGKQKRADLWAMVSVRPYARWPDIPREPLLKRLLEVTKRLARSDEDKTPKGFRSKADLWIEATIPTRFD